MCCGDEFLKFITACYLSVFEHFLQVVDLPSTTPMSRLAYWQSEALSRELPARVGSQSQLNARQLVSCPSLAAALVSDPDVVLAPFSKPPKQSEVIDWLRQLNYGHPVDSKQHTAANNVPPVGYGQPVDSKHTVVPAENTELANTTVTNAENQDHEALRSEKQGFNVAQQKNDNDNDEIETENKKSLLQKRQSRVSFLTDMRQTAVNLAAELAADVGAKFEEDLPVSGNSCRAGAEDGGGSWKIEEVKSPASDSSSILLCSQPSSGSRSLPKASFIDLEVPASWRARRQSQMSDSSRHSGSVDVPPSSAGGSRQHVASTPTSGIRSRQDGDLSVISCSPITPRTTSDRTSRTRRTHSPTVGTDKDEDEADMVMVPCSPLTPVTSSQLQCVKNTRTDEDVTIIPCTPVSGASSWSVKTGSLDERLSTSDEVHQDDAADDGELTVIPCSPVSPTTAVLVQAAQNKPQNKPQGVVPVISRLKVILCFFPGKQKTDCWLLRVFFLYRTDMV